MVMKRVICVEYVDSWWKRLELGVDWDGLGWEEGFDLPRTLGRHSGFGRIQSEKNSIKRRIRPYFSLDKIYS